MQGKGIPKNYNEAIKWYRQSADQKNAIAQFNLGQMYYEVDRVVKDKNVHLLGVIGGLLPTPDEILEKIDEIGGN